MSKSEQALEELFTVYHIPCIKVHGFDFLIKFSNEYFFVEHKKAFLNKRCWVTMAHIPAIEYQVKVAKRFGFKTLLIVDIPLKGLFMADLDKFNNRALKLKPNAKQHSVTVTLRMEDLVPFNSFQNLNYDKLNEVPKKVEAPSK